MPFVATSRCRPRECVVPLSVILPLRSKKPPPWRGLEWADRWDQP